MSPKGRPEGEVRSAQHEGDPASGRRSLRRTAGRLRPLAASAAFVALCALAAAPVHSPREVHGSSDAYAEPGIALAWGVQRGADEARTQVRVRIVADPARYPRVAVVGRDPFTQAERGVLAPVATAGLADLVLPRAHFADFPRTEFRFHAPGEATDAPSVIVFYLGVPDTTPEFAAAAALDRDLDERIQRAAQPSGEKR